MIFSLTDAQFIAATKWSANHVVPLKGHACVAHVKGGAIGGALTYQFTPTSLGPIQKVVCACGAELDLTDYDAF